MPNTSLLKWMDVFETGIAELDAWHRKLVNDCNHLLRLLAADASWAMIVAKAWDLGSKPNNFVERRIGW